MYKYIAIIRANYEPEQPKVEEIEAETVLDAYEDVRRRYHLDKKYDGTDFNDHPGGVSVVIGKVIPLITDNYL